MTTPQRVVMLNEAVTLEPVGLPEAARSAVAAVVDASVADHTRTAYSSNWVRFEFWCTAEGHVPAADRGRPAGQGGRGIPETAAGLDDGGSCDQVGGDDQRIGLQRLVIMTTRAVAGTG